MKIFKHQTEITRPIWQIEPREVPNELLLIHFCHHYSGTEQPVAHISVH